MKSSAKKIELASVDDLFSTEESRQDEQLEKIQEIPLSELHPFKDHPFKVKDDDAMIETADSIKKYGVLVPAIARPLPDGGYELVAGHRRRRASELAGKETMPVIVRDLDDDAATIIMVDSNLQRENLLPSERAFAYKMKLEAIKHQGARTDLTSVQVEQKLSARDQVAKEAGERSGIQVMRYVRFFDLAIGNVPFGQYQVNDKVYNKLNFNIHNYFFAKALDQVRPGGVVAFVTSRYTMDAKDSTVRRYLAQRAELLGAIRLPNDAFKKNAGAEVVSDIIFLQKRDRPLDIVPEWTQTGQTEDGFAINRYFIDHPEMVLGRQEPVSTAHGMDYTVNPIEGLELSDQLHDAVKYIHGTYQEAELPELGEGEAIDTSIPADPNVKNYSYAIVDGQVYYRENSRMVRPDLNATAEARVKGLVGLRDCVQELIDLQMDAAVPDSMCCMEEIPCWHTK